MNGKRPASIPEIDREFVEQAQAVLAKFEKHDPPSTTAVYLAANRLLIAAAKRNERVEKLAAWRS